MDANEKLTFINRLTSLSGTQAREALKQMTMNCNTKHTTIARALRNAIHQHAPLQSESPVTTQSSPTAATPSRAAGTKKKPTACGQEITKISGDEESDDETPVSKRKTKHKRRRGDINPDPNIGRLILEKSTPKRQAAREATAVDASNWPRPLTTSHRKVDKMSPADSKGSTRDIKRKNMKTAPTPAPAPLIIVDSDSTTSDTETSDTESSDSEVPRDDEIPGRDSSGSSSSDASSSDSGDSDAEASDAETSDSQEASSSKYNRHQLQQTNGSSSTRAVYENSKRSSTDLSAQASKNKVINPKTTAAPKSGKKGSGPLKQDRATAGGSSMPVANKRKSLADDQSRSTDSTASIPEMKKAKRDQPQTPRGQPEDRTCRRCHEIFLSRELLFKHLTETAHFSARLGDRTCRRCHEVFTTRDLLFEHLSKTLHFGVGAGAGPIPVIHSSIPSSPAARRPSVHLYPSRYRPSPRALPRPGATLENQQQRDQQVDTGIDDELDDEAYLASGPVPKSTPTRGKSVPLPAFIKEPNSFPQGPTPAPMVLARQRSGGDSSSQPPGRPRPKIIFGVPSLLPAQYLQPLSNPVRPDRNAKTAGEREYKCRFCGTFFRFSENSMTACSRHNGECDISLYEYESRQRLIRSTLGHPVKLTDTELVEIGQRRFVPSTKMKWSGCGHWVQANAGCTPSAHDWNRRHWRDPDGTVGKGGH